MSKAAFLLSGLLLLGLSTSAVASDRALQPQAVVAQQQLIRPDLEAGTGAYAKLTPAKREELLAQQDRLFELLEGKTTAAELDATQRQEIFAAEDAIKATQATTTASADEEPMICKREKILGSHFSTRTCMTKSQRDEERRASREGLERTRGRTVSPPSNTP